MRHLDRLGRAAADDKSVDQETQQRDEDAGKESGPEARYLEAPHQRRNQHHHQRVDHQQKQAKGEQRERQGQDNQQRLDDGVGKAQQQRSAATISDVVSAKRMP